MRTRWRRRIWLRFRPVKGTRWNGKTWIYPFELRMFPIVYNKELFTKAGLDPDHPPTTWPDFLAALEKLKASGTTPIVLGLKDGIRWRDHRRRPAVEGVQHSRLPADGH
jgi:ABC-type glycerol-3-phosphate transport system substrate-binding protein